MLRRTRNFAADIGALRGTPQANKARPASLKIKQQETFGASACRRSGNGKHLK
jgi:hypothetical protein